MDRFRVMQAFVQVAEEGSFSSAARRLGLSAPSITRAIAALEAHLGTQLLKRTTRIVRLTEAGTRYHAACRHILAELAEADGMAKLEPVQPQGTITVTAPAMFGRLHAAPVLIDFLALHPRVTGRMLLVDRMVDLIEEGVDVAIRIAHLPDSTLRATKVGMVRRVVCASPAYLAEHGAPKGPADLVRHVTIDFTFASPSRQWAFLVIGRSRVVHPRPGLVVNSAEVAVAGAVAGRGVARLLSYQVEAEIRAGALQVVLAEFEPPPTPVHVVHVEGQHSTARVRAFVDFAVEQLRAGSWSQGLGP